MSGYVVQVDMEGRRVTEELQTLLEVAAQLEASGIQYMVSGSMAMNFYAQPRMTRDIDIVVELSVSTAKVLSAALGKRILR